MRMQSGTSRRALLRAGAGGAAGFLAAAVASRRVQAAAGSPILGCYVGNPNGNDRQAMDDFERSFDRFTAAMGSKPAFMNVFTDFSLPLDKLPSSAGWGAWSFSRSSRIRSIKPVIGLPMAVNTDWKQQPAVGTFRDI